MSSTKVRRRSCASVLAFAALAVGALIAALAPAQTGAQSANDFPELTPGQRVYDQTGNSLSASEITDLEARLQKLQQVGANAIVYVRALDATPDETLDQVEALQQAWVAETGADQDSAVAILINRNPDDATDARAGIFVGSTFDDGNVPRGEQVAIVDEELIPPLRDGDVYASLVAGVERLEQSIISGPPRNAFEKWSDDAGRSWVPWAGVAAAATGLFASLLLFRRREVVDRPDQPPTTNRPSENLPPAIAGALVSGGPQASAVPATILDLARRDALNIEPESEGGTFSKPKVRIRLLDHGLVRDDVEETLWRELEKRAEDGNVSSKNLQKTASDSSAVRKAVERRLIEGGWLDPAADHKRAPFLAIFVLATLLAIGSFVVAIVGGTWLPVVGLAALAGVAVAALVFLQPVPNPHTGRAGRVDALEGLPQGTGESCER